MRADRDQWYTRAPARTFPATACARSPRYRTPDTQRRRHRRRAGEPAPSHLGAVGAVVAHDVGDVDDGAVELRHDLDRFGAFDFDRVHARIDNGRIAKVPCATFRASLR